MKSNEWAGLLLIVASIATCVLTDSPALRLLGIALGIAGLFLVGAQYRRRRSGVSAVGNYDLHAYHGHGGDDGDGGSH